MRLQGQESLSTDAQASSGLRHLIYRSGIAVLVISTIIALVSMLPYPAAKRQATHGQDCSPHDHLRHVLVLHRHGERSSVRWYDFEGEWAWDDSDIAIGKLTVNGVKQAFELGQNIRSTYAHQMKLDQEEAVTIYSTDLDRTVDTANSVLLGLLSEHETEANKVEGVCQCREEHGKRSPPDCLATCLTLQKVPKTPEVQVRPRKDKDGNDLPAAKKDPALYQTDVCKGYSAWRDELESRPEWMELPQTRFTDAAKLSSELIGKEKLVKTLDWPSDACQGCLDTAAADYNYLGFMETLWSNLVCYESIPSPYDSSGKYTNKQLFHSLQPMSEYVWKARFAAGPPGRMSGGVLLHEWLQVLKDSAEQWQKCETNPDDTHCSGSPAKMTIYSAHDTTVYSLLAALGATEHSELPGFTAHVIMELWEEHNSCEGTHDFSVRILYNPLPFDAPGASQSAAVLKTSPACKDGLCKLKDFEAGVRNSIMAPEDCERGDHGASHRLLHEPEDKQCCSAQAAS